MKRMLCLAAALVLAVAGCCGACAEMEEGSASEMKMNVRIGEYNFSATLEDSAAAAQFAEMMREGPVSVELNDYGGFEKVGGLGTSLRAEDARTTTQPGDIVLYNSHDIVLFYGSNTWAYTRLGHIDDLTDWSAALGGGSVTAVFTLSE